MGHYRIATGERRCLDKPPRPMDQWGAEHREVAGDSCTGPVRRVAVPRDSNTIRKTDEREPNTSINVRSKGRA